MAGSTFGSIFSITTWGESHGKAIGVVVDGCPAGLPLEEADIQEYLDRRKPGQSQFTTMRKEQDQIQILSGVFQGRTTGCPISLLVMNADQRSKDYGNIADSYRPGHADYTYDQKYGFRDYRGGGRSSGRETIGRVAAGAIASKLLKELGISVHAYTLSIGSVSIDRDQFALDQCASNPLYMPDASAAAKAQELVQECMNRQDSMGGVVECIVEGLPAGVGDPCFKKLDANLAKALMSIGAVKAVEIGDGIITSQAFGSQNNDSMYIKDGTVKKPTNHGGGIYGGISDGSPIVVRAHIKPTPSIAQPQDTITKSGENISLSICGRHDPIIVPRAVVVVECMTALTVLDSLLSSMTSNVDQIKSFFQNK